jgi:hypothetical protein
MKADNRHAARCAESPGLRLGSGRPLRHSFSLFPFPFSPSHSLLNATIGSILVARRAGM